MILTFIQCLLHINKEYYNISLERLKHCERENVQISLFEKGVCEDNANGTGN